MKIFGNFLGMLFGVAVLAILLAGGYFLFKYVISVFDTLPPQVGTLAAIASVVAVLCAVIIAEGLRSRGQNNFLSFAVAEKVKVYEELLSYWSEQLKMQIGGNARQADAELVRLEKLLALHGSAKVITAYFSLRRSAKQETRPGDEPHETLNNLLMEMRKDLGRSEFKHKEGYLLNLLLERN